MSKFKKMLELECLVESGGDEARINELRIELGILKPREVKRAPLKKRFDIGWYKNLKRQGVPDGVIAEELGVSRQHFTRFKKSIGLTCRGKGIV